MPCLSVPPYPPWLRSTPLRDPRRFPIRFDAQSDKDPVIGKRAADGWEDPRLEVNVIFTTIPGTLAALRLAGEYARDLRGRISILATQIVPYPLPLERPPVAPEFTAERYRTVAGDQKIETRVQVYLCRDSRQALLNALKPNSLVVVGGRKRWWATREQALVKFLRAHSHHVIIVDLK
jgi:hypothetical protein